MRLVNDKKQDTTEVKSVDLFDLISQMFLVSVGIATWVFSPAVMVLSHCRFINPWSKLAGLGGAVLALLFLEVPLPQVLMGFVLGLFVADGFERQVKPFQLLSQSLAVSLVAALGCLLWAAVLEHMSVSQYWTHAVLALVEKLKASNAFQGSMNWAAIQDLVLYEGPFLYLSASLLISWIAMGTAAHFGWVKDDKNVYSSANLKTLRLSRWMNVGFIISFTLTLTVSSNYQYLAAGIFRVLSGFMFIQGSVCLSNVLAQRGVRRGVRSFIYCVAVLLGFYALVGMGIMSPWILRKKWGYSPQILPNKLEEQT